VQESGSVKDGQAQNSNPAAVPTAAIQAGEATTLRERWSWAQASVWTDRMLMALEQGVKGDVWFSLMDKVWSDRNLWCAWCEVAANEGSAGVDHETIAMFEKDPQVTLKELSDQLQAGTYRPQAVRRVYIPKAGGGKRPLGIPTVRDRVVQAALRHVLEPIFERDFARHSYGFRPGKGCKDALRQVDELLKAGYTHVVDADLKSYFDSIPHEQLMMRLRAKVADGKVLKLVQAFLTQGVLEGLSQWTPTSGSPQGAVISPLLSNIYLDPLDHLMEQQGLEMVRYADDFVVLCRDAAEAERALETVRQWTAQAGLTLHPDKTRVANLSPTAREGEAFEFLGYRFTQERSKTGQSRITRQPRDKSRAKFKDAIRSKTRRAHGQSLAVIIASVNLTVKGWYAYFKHASRAEPRRPDTLERLDQWIRMRLRSILRKRMRLPGCGRGKDHYRWPNKFFEAGGLFSMAKARLLAHQSVLR
jgi:RNA-directed DNA polymerase